MNCLQFISRAQGSTTRWRCLSSVCIFSLLIPGVPGGMALQGNSWSCSCENVWLGRWLRRWMREALQLHTSVVERGQTIRAVVRTITCKTSEGGERPLLELDTDTPCQLPPVSGSGSSQELHTVITCLLLTILLTRIPQHWGRLNTIFLSLGESQPFKV